MAEGLYAGSSVQSFADPTLETLERTHGDTKGFLDYVAHFNTINFRATDGAVKQWRFDPGFDDWPGWLGIDSVKVYYHAGHGFMDGSGVFDAPMGAAWSMRTSALSRDMKFADQRLRYLFLSTCDSLRTEHGDDPFRTWAAANTGCRMIFGFGSTSLDWDGYGSTFFSRWNTGISFSQAWQDASLGLTHNQVVSSTACGATAEEAQGRLWNERTFDGGRVRDDWYWWRWAGLSPDVEVEVHLGIDLPHSPPLHFRVARRRGELDRVADVARRFDVEAAVLAESGDPGRDGDLHRPRLILTDDDGVSIVLATPDPGAERAPIERLRDAADEAARRLDPEGARDLVFDRFTSSYHAGASRGGDRVEPGVADFTAHYRQRIDGAPVVMGGDGHVAITLDRSGRLCRIHDRTIDIAEITEAAPPPEGNAEDVDARALVDDATQRRGDRCAGATASFDPDADEVGYRISGDDGYLVARREVTITAGGFSKRHLIEVPLS